MTQIELHLDGLALSEILRGPTGPVFRHVVDRAQVVQAAAYRDCPVKTGVLRDSIVKRIERTDTGDVAVRIVVDTTSRSPRRASYAMFVHDGTPPHLIVGNPLLAFDWPAGPTGGLFITHSVNHPGNKPNPFLSKNLYLAVA